MIEQILVGKKTVVTVERSASVREIASLLYQHRIGAVVVVDDGEIRGLVSERDICAGLHLHGGAILDKRASEVMSSPVLTARPCDSEAEAMSVMTERRFRHLPIVDGGRLVGLISIGDLVKRRLETAEAEAAAMKDYISHG